MMGATPVSAEVGRLVQATVVVRRSPAVSGFVRVLGAVDVPVLAAGAVAAAAGRVLVKAVSVGAWGMS